VGARHAGPSVPSVGCVRLERADRAGDDGDEFVSGRRGRGGVDVVGDHADPVGVQERRERARWDGRIDEPEALTGVERVSMRRNCYNIFTSRRLEKSSSSRLPRLTRSTEETRIMRMRQQRDSHQERRVRTLLSAALAAFLVFGSQVAANAGGLDDHPNSLQSCEWTPTAFTIEAFGSTAFVMRFDGIATGSGNVRVYQELSGYYGDFADFDWFTANADISSSVPNNVPPDEATTGTEIFYSVKVDGDGNEFKGVELCRVDYTFLPVGGLSTDDEEPTPSPIALSCSPDPVVAGGVVTCLVTGGDPNVEILWRASYNPAFAGQAVTLDAEGNGSFSFVAPAAALGLPVTVELVEWDRTAVVTVGGPVPASVPAGEGQGGLALGVTLGGLLVLAGASRLRREGAVA